MKSRIALLASAAAGLAWSFAPSARAQATPSPPIVAAHAPLRLKLDLHDFLRIEGSREYGLAGLNLRLRLPKQIAPYVEGRLGDGVVAARPDGALMIPGTPIGLNGAGGANWMFTRGVDVGVDVHRFNHRYLSVALGWFRTSWPVAGFDVNDRQVLRNVWHDSFVLKIGFTM